MATKKKKAKTTTLSGALKRTGAKPWPRVTSTARDNEALRDEIKQLKKDLRVAHEYGRREELRAERYRSEVVRTTKIVKDINERIDNLLRDSHNLLEGCD